MEGVVYTTQSFYFLFAFLRSTLSKMMKRRAGDVEVNMLLYAIGKTTSFEKLLAQRFLQSKYMEMVS